MNIIAVADSLERTRPLTRAAENAGCRILKYVGPNDEVAHYVKTIDCDAIVFICDEVDRAELREMRSISNQCPKPILVMTRDSRTESIEAAVRSGATAYVVDCTDLGRLDSMLQVARARFQQQQALLDELDSTRMALQQRKTIDKAKALLMKQRNIDEDAAYKLMRSQAMSNNKKIHEIAGHIVTAAELLL